MVVETPKANENGTKTTCRQKSKEARQHAETTGQMEANSKAQAVIEFELDGTIITANDNFLNVLGHTLEEVQGLHHRMFVDDAYSNSAEYKAFWEKLKRGEYEAAEHKRLGKMTSAFLERMRAISHGSA